MKIHPRYALFGWNNASEYFHQLCFEAFGICTESSALLPHDPNDQCISQTILLDLVMKYRHNNIVLNMHSRIVGIDQHAFLRPVLQFVELAARVRNVAAHEALVH
jgi:hypothetical protein